jgi:post-segregation antitoxin (ccd killing protein)
MKSTYDQQNRKCPINLTLNEDLALQARARTESLSGVVEIAIATWNDFGDKVAPLADDHTTL